MRYSSVSVRFFCRTFPFRVWLCLQLYFKSWHKSVLENQLCKCMHRLLATPLTRGILHHVFYFWHVIRLAIIVQGAECVVIKAEMHSSNSRSNLILTIKIHFTTTDSDANDPMRGGASLLGRFIPLMLSPRCFRRHGAPLFICSVTALLQGVSLPGWR